MKTDRKWLIKMRIVDWYKKFGYEKRTLFFSHITMVFNYLWSLYKIVSGSIIGSHFVIINGVFTLTIGIAKTLCIWGTKQTSNKKVKVIYLVTNSLLIASNIIYIVYMTRLFKMPADKNMTLIMSLSYAIFAFTSLTLSIIGLFRTKNSHPLLNLIKVVSLLTALTDISMTQIIWLSTDDQDVVNKYNAIFGIAIGLLGLGITIFLVVKASKKKDFLEFLIDEEKGTLE